MRKLQPLTEPNQPNGWHPPSMRTGPHLLAHAHPPQPRIGIAGPIEYGALRDLLDAPSLERIRTAKLVGNGGTPVVLLVRELIRRGRQVVVVTLDPGLAPGTQLTLRGPQLLIRAGGLRGPRARALDLFAAERRFIAQAVREEAPSVVHAHWTYEFALGALDGGRPTLVTAHDAPWWVLRYDHHPYRILRTLMALRSAKRITMLTTVSPYVADHWRRLLKYRGALTTIPNGMPETMFTDQTRLPAHPEALVFATILQGWMGRKNGQNAILAFAAVRQHHPGCTLRMYGDGHGPDGPAQHWARARGIDAGISFEGKHPYASLMQQVRESVDVLVHPSLEEAHPMVLIECMAMGIPAIGGKAAGGVPYSLNYGKAGLLCDVTAPADSARAKSRLVEEPGLYGRIGQAGCDYAREHFSIGHVVDLYEEAYAKTIACGT